MSALPRLIALSPGALEEHGVPLLLAGVRAALAAGLPGILLRESVLLDGAFLELAREVRAMTRSAGAWFAVHDRVHVAIEVEADAVHLGFRSLAPKSVRASWGDRLALGLSTHAEDDHATWQAADYLFHGPVRTTPSKPAGSPGQRAPIGFEGLARAVASTERPLFALGGMRPEDLAPALHAGAHGVAVLSGILGTRDPAAATRAYLASLAAAETARS